MNVAEAAYRMLVELAQADGSLHAQELALLERYRRALRVPRRRRFKTRRGLPKAEAVFSSSPEENVHALEMMVRVAHADGHCTKLERERLEAVAQELGIGHLQYARIFVAIEDEGRRSHRHGRSLEKVSWVLGTGLVLVAVALFVTRPWDRPSSAQVEQLVERIDALSTRRALEDDRLVRNATEQVRKQREALERRLERTAALAGAPVEAGTTPPDSVRLELDDLHAQLDELHEELHAFKSIEARYGQSVLLIAVRYDLVRGERRASGHGYGSGFFLSADGLIATNKHVVQPWKFSPNAAERIADGWELDEASVRLAAWPSGTRFRGDQEELDYSTAYDTRDDSLELLTTTEDRYEIRRARRANGDAWDGRLHVLDDSDLALLQAQVTEPVTPFQLPDILPGIEKLDHVMVLGFPTGTEVLERRVAETSPSVGDVSKVEETILITAPIVPGNSGGPVVDLRGRVVGIATRRHGEPTLATCICVHHLFPLLPRAETLVQRAEELWKRGSATGARGLIDLAGRGSLDAQAARRIDVLRQQLPD